MKSKELPLKFLLLHIQTEQFAIQEEKFKPKKEVELSSTLNFMVNPELQRIKIITQFEFIQVKNVFLKIAISCEFQMKEESWSKLLHTPSNEIIVPKDFLMHLSVISVGTCRGILFSKTEGSPMAKFILPMINLREMILDDLHVSLETTSAE